MYSIASPVQGTKFRITRKLPTPAYTAAAYFGNTPPSNLKYGGVQHWNRVPTKFLGKGPKF